MMIHIAGTHICVTILSYFSMKRCRHFQWICEILQQQNVNQNVFYQVYNINIPVTLNDRISYCLLMFFITLNRNGQRYYIIDFAFLQTWYLRNTVMDGFHIWHKDLLGLRGELVRFWWWEVKGQGSCGITSAPCCKHLKESLPIWCKHTVGPKDVLIRIWWCEVKGHGCYKVMAVLMWISYLRNTLMKVG